MSKQSWLDHWLFGLFDWWLTVAVVVEFIAYWQWGWIGVLAATTLMAVAVAVGFIIEKRIGTVGKSN
jgi:hypothetical protein